ncbi:MAG TPA: putative photosynthetic complex assembly protein PuhE [Lamprocystis sp. (in: g-proteobacteria)]|nr:putative photosynthetic complex assembly protein PuhE [Lamprocystis sp. (in: g-proteobacteria)]
MLDYAAPALFALLVWWLGTGIILYLDGLPARTYRRSLKGAAGILVGAFCGLWLSSTGTSLAHAYVAFACGVLVWGSLEMSYFMGLVSGPRKAPCPPGCGGWRRFGLAIGTSLYHEISVVATGALLVVLWSDAVNQVGVWTYGVLWIMRWSAKLNVFLGVPNLHIDWLPVHLRFLQTYMGQRSMNYLFPLSVTGGTIVCVWMISSAVDIGTGVFDRTGQTLVATLLALAVLEHWFLVLPLPDEALWSWAFKPRSKRPPVRQGMGLRTDQESTPTLPLEAIQSH